MKKLIRKWLGLKDTHTCYTLCLKRTSKVNKKKEDALQRELIKLVQKYPDTPMLYINKLDFSWQEMKGDYMIDVSFKGKKGTPFVICNNVFRALGHEKDR